MRHESSTAYLNRYRTRSNPTKSVCVWISVDLSLKLENLMIYESHYWKDELQAIAKKLRRRRAQRRWSESSFANLEKEVMVGFYSVRKLYEASKLSEATVNRQIPVSVFPSNGKTVHKLNWTYFWEHYDLESPISESRDTLTLCNQFVHSYIFCPEFSEHKNLLDGIFFASDRQRHKSLSRISIEEIARLFDNVGSDYPSSSIVRFNPTKIDYEFIDKPIVEMP
jgi:hypothetical protein